MKKNYYFITLVFVFILSLLLPTPGQAQSLIEEDSIAEAGVDGVLIAKAKKKKKKKKKKKSKSKSKSKSKKGSEEDLLDGEDTASTKKDTKTKDSNSFIGIMAGYLAKGATVSNVYADAKVGFGSFFPYVDFIYTLGVEAFSIIHVGGGVLYSIPMGTSLQILAGVGAQYGMWSRANQEYNSQNIEDVFGPDSEITSDEDIPDSAAFIFVVPRVEIVYHLTDVFALTGEVGGLVAVSEGVALSDEGKKFAGTTFTIGAGGMITF